MVAEDVDVVGETSPLEAASRGSASVTVLPVDERLPGSADLPSVVALAPGAVVRRLGGLGAYASVSIRGSTARQVEVLLDGIPLNPDGAVAVNLAELPLASLSQVEVYRGSGPLVLGAAPLGGVVQLVTREDAVTSGTFGVGSLGTVRGSAVVARPLSKRADILLAVEGLSVENGFSYLDDRGTPYTPDDDRVRERVNADRAQGILHGRFRLGTDRLRLTLLNGLLVREEGVPGFTFAPTASVRYGVARDLQAVRLDTAGRAGRAAVLGWVQVRRESLRDEAGEIGLSPTHTDDLALSPGLRVTGRAWLGPGLLGEGLVEVRGDRWKGEDRLDLEAPVVRDRGVGRSGAGLTAHLGPLTLNPVVLGTRITSDDVSVGSIDPRLGLRLDPTERIAWTANVGRYLRPPDLDELFGDRGPLVGNPELRPERGTQADMGLRYADERVHAEVIAFSRHVRDGIAWVQNAQQRSRPVNLDRSRVHGVEAAIGVQQRPVELWASATRTWSVQRSEDPAYDGKALPHQPAWDVHTRAALVAGDLRVGHTLSHVGATWNDAVNWYRAAPRTLHGVFARFTEGPLSVEAEVLNLTDRITEEVPVNPLDPGGPRAVQAVTDFVGQPLPGRTWLLTLRWSP